MVQVSRRPQLERVYYCKSPTAALRHAPCTTHAMLILIVVMVVPVYVTSQGMGTCPMTTDISVNLSVSFEQAGRTVACPGERVIFICEVNRSTSVQVAAEPFICRADPVSYLATDPPGSPGGTMPTDVFQANLTDVQREPGTLMAYYKVTLTATLTNEIANTTVECSDQLTSSSSIQRKTLIESQRPTPPPGLDYRLESDNCSCILPVIGSAAVTCTCLVTDVLLFWEEPEASGMFDVECYVVTVSNNTNTRMMPTVPSHICDTTSAVSSDIDIMTTSSTTLTFPISPGINYSVLVWTVSKCGQLSDPAMVPTSEEFLSIEEHLATQTLPGPITIFRNVTILEALLTTPNIVLTGVGGALLGLAVLASLLRLCFIDLQERTFKWMFGIERVLTGCSLLMMVITVLLLLVNINEPCDEGCLQTNNVTTSLFLIFAFISAVWTGIITCYKLHRYCTPEGLVLQHPKYVKIQEEELQEVSRVATDSGSQPESDTGGTSNEGDDLHKLKIEKSKRGRMLVVVKGVEKKP